MKRETKRNTPAMSPDTPAPPVVPVCAPPLAALDNPLTAADLLGRVLSIRQLQERPFTAATWLWHGYLGPGKATLLTSQWKSGKTTLVALLLARMQQGGQLLGLPVSPGKAFVVSEESEADWQPRFHLLGIRDHVDLLCRPFLGVPSMDQWLALIDTAATLRQRKGTDLVVIDSLSQFLPAHCEVSVDALKAALNALFPLMAAGMSVLLPHHPKKGKTLAGQAARGNGHLLAFVNILIEMGYYDLPDDLDRRRRLVAFSRSDETPRHLLVELRPDNTDYDVLHTGMDAALGENWQAVLHVLEGATTKKTRQEILDNWLADYDKPEPLTLWRWLSRAVAQGVLRQEGTGRAHDPFRYWLPSRDLLVRPDNCTAEELNAWNARVLAEIVAGWDKEDEAKAQRQREREAKAGAPAVPETADPASPVAAAAPAELAPPIAEPPAATAPAPEPPAPLAEVPLPVTQDTEAAPVADAQCPPPTLATARPVSEPTAPEVKPAASTATAPEPPAAPATTPPEPPLQLPYPWSIMNPAEVPQWVWEQARKAQKRG
jgi:hypothetical protein